MLAIEHKAHKIISNITDTNSSLPSIIRCNKFLKITFHVGKDHTIHMRENKGDTGKNERRKEKLY